MTSILSHGRSETVSPRGGVGGFSLMEVLVAAAILLFVVVLLVSITGQVSKMWTEVNGQNQRRATARAVLQFMANELQTARLPTPFSPASSSAGGGNLQFIVNLPAAGIPASCLNPHAAFWQAAVANNRSKGDIAEIGYFVSWDTSKPGVAAAHLSRFYADPATPGDFLIYSGTANQWTSSALTIAPAVPPTYRGWLADNVIALWVRCLNRAGAPITKNAAGSLLNGGYGFDSRQGYTDPSTSVIHPAPALPPCVEISLVVVDSKTAEKITAPLVVTSPASPADLSKDKSTTGSILNFVDQLPAYIKSGATVFSTTIFLPNAAN